MRSLCAGVLLALVATGAAHAAECPGNPNALGTSRVLVVDPAEHARLGTMQYTETLPLEDREVVLTFDDGPLPPYTNRALDIMAAECVKATYFLVGRMARAYPEAVRQIQAAGHTIGTHSQTHPFTFHRMSAAQAEQEVEGGIASVRAALGDADIAPFFRIPGLLRGETVEKYLAARSLMTWSADFPADDWKHIKAAEIVHRAISRIEAKGRGMLLLHDIQPATVLALPTLLKELKTRGYRIVHVEAATADRPKTATLPAQWVMKWSKRVKRHWPGPRISIETLLAESSLPAAAPESFGIGQPFGPKTTIALSPPRAAHRLVDAAWPMAPGDDARVAQVAAQVAAKTVLPAASPQNFGYSDSFAPMIPAVAAFPAYPLPAAAAPARERRAALPAGGPPREKHAAPSAPKPVGIWPFTAAALPKSKVQ